MSASEVSSLILDDHPELSQTLSERVWTDPSQITALAGGDGAPHQKVSLPAAAAAALPLDISLADLCAEESAIIRCKVAIPKPVRTGLSLRGVASVTGKGTQAALRAAARRAREKRATDTSPNTAAARRLTAALDAGHVSTPTFEVEDAQETQNPLRATRPPQ